MPWAVPRLSGLFLTALYWRAGPLRGVWRSSSSGRWHGQPHWADADERRHKGGRRGRADEQRAEEAADVSTAGAAAMDRRAAGPAGPTG